MLNWKGKGISFSEGEEGKNLTGLYVGQAKNYMLQVARRIPRDSRNDTRVALHHFKWFNYALC